MGDAARPARRGTPLWRWGVWIVLFGALYWVLPQFGFSHLAFFWLGDAAEPAAIGMLVVGGAMIVAGIVAGSRGGGGAPS